MIGAEREALRAAIDAAVRAKVKAAKVGTADGRELAASPAHSYTQTSERQRQAPTGRSRETSSLTEMASTPGAPTSSPAGSSAPGSPSRTQQPTRSS